MKKIKHILVFSCAFLALAMASQTQQETSVSSEINDYSEYPVISEGIASYGSAAIIGKACVITKSKQLDKMRKGDIVVASAVHSTWYSALSNAAAIITEKGDDSSNAIALGKKLDIPVIVGASEIMKHVIDGQTIMCDPVTRNVHHVAYPNPKEVHFDTLHMPQKECGYQTLHDKLVKPGTTRPARPTVGKRDDCAPFVEDKNMITSQYIQEYKAKRITKDVYASHFARFKKFALSIQSQYKSGKWWGMLETGAKLTGRDDFTIDCMAIGDLLLDSDEKYFARVLERLENPEYIQYMDILVDKCVHKSGNMKQANWIARKSHEAHVEAVANDLPAEIDKKKLMEHPKEYKKIENIVNKEKREDLIAAGLFAMYCMDNKLF